MNDLKVSPNIKLSIFTDEIKIEEKRYVLNRINALLFELGHIDNILIEKVES